MMTLQITAWVTPTDIIHSIGAWFTDTGWQIALILIGAQIIRFLLVMFVSSFMHRAVKFEQTFMIDLDRKKRIETFTALINAILSVLVWVVAGMLILQKLGVQAGPLMTGAGVLGVGLAFGTQALVKDFISGLFIVMENQYRVGDQVELDSTKGRVEHVGIRTTVLRDEDGNVHFVPNGIIQRTTNLSMGHTSLKLGLTVAASNSPQQIEEIINKLGDKMASEKKWQPHFISPFTYSEIGEVTNRKHELIVTAKVKNAYRGEISSEFRERLLERLDRKGIKALKLAEISDAPKEEEKK